MRAILHLALSPRFAALCLLLYSHAALCVLGDGEASVRVDQQRFKGRLSRSANGPLTTHTISLPDGSSVKEYVNAEGVVFAVSWRSRLKPDLAALLGAHYPLQAAAAPAGVAASKRQRSLRQPNLVVHQAGRMNAFGGLAYLPPLVPPGLDADALR